MEEKMKNRSTLIAPILGMGLFSLLLTGCGWSSGQATPEESKEAMATHHEMGRAPEKKSQGPDPSEAHQGISTEVRIDNFTFDPPQLTVSAGTKVTWINHDDVPHTATSTAKPKAFDSGTLDTDEKFSFVFTTPGTYKYFYAVHPRMIGQIVVK
jgi:plastocyanin